MNDKTRIYILGFLTLLSGALPLAAVLRNLLYPEIISGVSAAGFILLKGTLDRAILEASVTKKVKSTRDLIETSALFAILLSGIASGLAINIIPVELATATALLLGTAKVFQLQVTKRYRKSYEFRLGESIWIGVAAITFILQYSNQYFLFYGYSLISLLLLYDILDIARRLENSY